MSSSFIISGFSDEIDSNIVPQFEHLNKLEISYFEPRGINGKNIADLEDREVEALQQNMEQYEIGVSSIGSPIGKIYITEDFTPHFEKFKRVAEVAQRLGTQYIRMFSFFIPEGDKPEKYTDEVLGRLSQMVDYAVQKDLILLHENEKAIYGDCIERCALLFERIKSEAFRGVFDPANFVQCGQDTIEAFDELYPYIEYMHIKDALEDGTVVPAGHGIGNLERIITRLDRNSYNGFLSLEPHLGSFEGLAALELDDKMEGLGKSNGDLFTLAYRSLVEILERI